MITIVLTLYKIKWINSIEGRLMTTSDNSDSQSSGNTSTNQQQTQQAVRPTAQNIAPITSIVQVQSPQMVVKGTFDASVVKRD